MITKIDMDNGSYPYAKDIGRVLAKTKLNSTHRGIIDVVLDQTYGWHDSKSNKEQKIKQRKVEEKITFKSFEEFIGVPFTKLSTLIKVLVQWKILFRKKQGRNYIYSFNTQVNQWDRQIFRKRFQIEGWGMVYQVVNFTNKETLSDDKLKVYQSGNYKFTSQVTKNTQQVHQKKGTKNLNNSLNNSPKKCSEKKYQFSELQLTLTDLLITLIKQNKPDRILTGNNYRKEWANDMRLTEEKDKRNIDRIREVIEFSQRDSFWKQNILSVGKLRKHFDELEMKMIEKEKKGGVDYTPPYLE